MQLGIKDIVSYAFYIMNLFLPNKRSVFISVFFEITLQMSNYNT